MTSAEAFIENRLQERRAAGSLRSLKPESELADLCSNDYLGFARSAVLKEMTDAEVNKFQTARNGSTGSRLLTGNTMYAEELEQQVASFHKSESGLIFNSGYDANLGLFSSLLQRGDTIILDELIHASIIDGARLSYANRYSFKHNDLQSLEEKLKLAKGNCYVAIESIYSMDGDTAPIAEIIALTEKYNANLIVDEAHAVGLYPAGIVAALGLQDRIFARLVTFGKALGCHGAIVLGNNLLRNYLINFARSFIYTTAAPFHQLVAIRMAYQLLAGAEEQVARLKGNIGLFKQKIIADSNYPLIESDSAIQCLVLKSNDKAKEMASRLQQAGLDVRAILHPTVPLGTERLRICLHAFNTEAEITLLVDTINQYLHG